MEYTIAFNNCPLSVDVLVDLISYSLSSTTRIPVAIRSRSHSAKRMCDVWSLVTRTETYPDFRFSSGDTVMLRSRRKELEVYRVSRRIGVVNIVDDYQYTPHMLRPAGSMFIHNHPDNKPETIVFRGFPLSKLEVMLAISSACTRYALDNLAIVETYEWEGNTIQVWDIIQKWVMEELEPLVPIGSIWDVGRRNSNVVITEGIDSCKSLSFGTNDGARINLVLGDTMLWYGGGKIK